MRKFLFFSFLFFFISYFFFYGMNGEGFGIGRIPAFLCAVSSVRIFGGRDYHISEVLCV